MSAFNSTILNSVAGEDNRLATGVVGAAAILATTAVYYALSSKDKDRDFPKLRGIQFYHAWNFFQRRYDFLHSNFKRNSGRSFCFNVLHHRVIALTGEDARQAFLFNQHFDAPEGFKILVGAVPRVGDADVATEEKTEEGDTAIFNKRLNRLLSKTRKQDVFPLLVQDIANRMDKWGDGGKTGRINPFTDVYNLVLVMTARMVSCRDLTENEADLKKLGELFSGFQASTTPASLLLPWFPSAARDAKREATTGLFTILYGYVERRRHAEPTSDALDVLIADGETTEIIVGFVMVALFAGVLNTGIVSCWMLVHLATHPGWKEKCRKEIQGFLSRHNGDSPSATLSEKFGAIPITAWEDELPTLDACIRESQRLAINLLLVRRNLGGNMKIGEQIVKQGDFLAYSLGDVHMNPEYYPEPYKYNPSRWLQPDLLPSAAYTFLGWGGGRHPCTGQKVAKLEMKLIMAMFLMRYEFDLVDKLGRFPNPLPVPNRNDVHQAGPVGDPCYFKFEKVAQ